MEDNNQTNVPLMPDINRSIDAEMDMIVENILRQIVNNSTTNPLLRPQIQPQPNYEYGIRYPYTSATTAALRASLQDKPVYKNVISDEGKKELTNMIYTSSLNINDTCPITQDQFENGETIIGLPCNHFFKSAEIQKWLDDNKAECPVCRYKLGSKEVKDTRLEEEDDEDEDIIDNEDEDAELVSLDENEGNRGNRGNRGK